MRNEWDYLAFRDYILAAAANVPGVHSQGDIARIIDPNLSPSLLSKWFRGREQPSDASLRKIKQGFARHGVAVSLKDLALLARRHLDDEDVQLPEGVQPPAPILANVHARKIDQILADDSPVPLADRQALDTVLDRLIEPYWRLMRRSRSRNSA